MYKHGLALFLSLEGDARRAAAKVKPADMRKDDGLQMVLGELDNCFLKHRYIECFLAYDKFTNETVAHQMLESANLPLMKKELVKTTLTTFTSDNMRSQILKIFCEEDVPAVSDLDKMNIKSESPDEDVNITMFGSSGQKSRNRKMRGSHRQQGNYSKYQENDGTYLRKNPLDEFGNVTTCDFCHSVYHYANKCPDKQRSYKGSNKRGSQNRNYTPSL